MKLAWLKLLSSSSKVVYHKEKRNDLYHSRILLKMIAGFSFSTLNVNVDATFITRQKNFDELFNGNCKPPRDKVLEFFSFHGQPIAVQSYQVLLDLLKVIVAKKSKSDWQSKIRTGIRCWSWSTFKTAFRGSLIFYPSTTYLTHFDSDPHNVIEGQRMLTLKEDLQRRAKLNQDPRVAFIQYQRESTKS